MKKADKTKLVLELAQTNNAASKRQGLFNQTIVFNLFIALKLEHVVGNCLTMRRYPGNKLKAVPQASTS